jgi:hypothetical protein
MIHEEYVSFDTAKLLKEAGFRELTKTHYSSRGQVWETALPEDYNDDFNCNTCNRPTQALAARWLREVHSIMVVPFFDDDMVQWYYVIDGVTKESGIECVQSASDYDSYEEALEAGLKRALEMIKERSDEQ